MNSTIAIVLATLGVAGAAREGFAQTRRATLPAGFVEVEAIVAVVGDKVITASELRRAEGSHQTSQQVVPADAERPRSPAALRVQTLQSLIDNVLVGKAAKDLGLAVDDKEVDAQIEQTRKRTNWTDEELDENVKKLGFSDLVGYRAHVRAELLRMQMLKVKLGSRLRITDEEVKRVIELEHGGGTHEDEVMAQHILIGVAPDASPLEVARRRERAWQVHDAIKQGAKSFEDLADEHSDDRGAEHGALGWQKRWTLDPTFANKLWSMKRGEVSGVVQTPFGFHIIKMLDRRRTDVKDKDLLEQVVRGRLSEEQLVRLYRAWIEELRATTHINLRLPNPP
ncbi:MAG: hypothetical protein EXR79_03900 [Myxococcales bacterium]|nr:hypothetical protein [Myxococcales bacterium]